MGPSSTACWQLALHGAVLVVGLLVVGAGDGGGLALDLLLQSEGLLGMQAHDARMGGDLGGVLVVERTERARRGVCGCGGGAERRSR